MKFYSLRMKKSVEVPEKDVSYRTTKNGRKQAMAMDPNGNKMFRFVAK